MQIGNVEKRKKKKAYCKSVHFFFPKSTETKHISAHIYSCILHFIFRASLSFAHTQSWLALRCFLITIPHYRSGGTSWMLLPPGRSGSAVLTLSHRALCPFATWITVPLRRDLKGLGRRMGNVSHPHYLLEEILHAVFLNRLLTKINASLFPTVSSSWHLPQHA